MADEATLRDTVVVDQTADPKTAVTEPAKADDPVRITEAPNPDALKIGQILLDSGISEGQLNDLLAAPKALEAMRYAIQNNPPDFLTMLDRSDPKTGEKFLESMADTYLNRYGDKGKPAGKSSDDSSTDLMREVKALREKTADLETREARRENAMQLATTTQRYNARVDDLLGLKEVKDLNLLPSELKGIRARLNVELGNDQNVVQRVAQGNFVDVPRTFKGIIEELASDRKGAIEAAKTQRDRSAKGALPDFASGPNLWMHDVPAGSSDSWDATEDGFAKALENASR